MKSHRYLYKRNVAKHIFQKRSRGPSSENQTFQKKLTMQTMHGCCPYLKKKTRHWDIEPNQQRGRPSWSNWLTRSCSRLLLLLQTWQYPIPRHPPNPQKVTDHELVTGPEEGVWGGFCKWSWITMPQIYTSMVWHPPKRDIFGTRKLKCRKENHPTRPLQIRCGADTNLLLRQASFASSLVKLEATLWW